MPKPTPGQNYTVVLGDNLSKIAAAAYGRPSLWRAIAAANVLRSGDPNLIFPGEVIFIPGDPAQAKPVAGDPKDVVKRKLTDNPNEVGLYIKGKKINVMSSKGSRAIDTCADGMTFALEWDGQSKTDPVPYGYEPAEVYLGNDLIIKGKCYAVSMVVDQNDIKKTVEVWTASADLVDSTMIPPLEFKDQTVFDIAKKIADRFSINVTAIGDKGAIIKRASADPNDTCWDFIAMLARQRSQIFTSSTSGDLVLSKIDPKRAPSAHLEIGVPPTISISVSADGRQRFGSYKALASSPKKAHSFGLHKDPDVPGVRNTTFRADELEDVDLASAAKWRAKKTESESFDLSVSVIGWRTLGGEMWTPGMTVTVNAPALISGKSPCVRMVKSASYSHDTGTLSTELTLVDPDLFRLD